MQREEVQVSALPVQYADYTLWQQQRLGSETDPDSPIARQIAFWTKTLEGLPEQLELPTDRSRPAIASYRGATVPLQIEPELHSRLVLLAREHQVSLFMVLQAALATLLPGWEPAPTSQSAARLLAAPIRRSRNWSAFSLTPWSYAPILRLIPLLGAVSPGAQR